MKSIRATFVCGFISLAFASIGSAQITHTFVDGDQYDNVGTGTPITVGTDATTTIETTLELTQINGGSIVRTNNSGLGLSTSANFTPGDSIVFDFDFSDHDAGAVVFESMTFKKQANDGTERFTLSSSDFQGRNYENIGWSTGITFTESTGTFTFTNNTGGLNTQTYDFTAGGTETPVAVNIGTSVTLGFVGTGSGASWGGFTVHAVPEPGTIGLLSACVFGFALCRRRKKPEVNAEA